MAHLIWMQLPSVGWHTAAAPGSSVSVPGRWRRRRCWRGRRRALERRMQRRRRRRWSGTWCWSSSAPSERCRVAYQRWLCFCSLLFSVCVCVCVCVCVVHLTYFAMVQVLQEAVTDVIKLPTKTIANCQTFYTLSCHISLSHSHKLVCTVFH